MKKIALGTLALLAIAPGVGGALAADLPSRKEPPPVAAPAPPPPLWTGFYVGLNLGGGWRDNSSQSNNWWLWNTPGVAPLNPWGGGGMWGKDGAKDGQGGAVAPAPGPLAPIAGAPLFWAASNNNSNSAGVIGGGQIGFNYQFGTAFLVGVETDFQGTSIGSGGGGGGWGWGGGGARLPWFGTVRGRLGWLVTPTLLLYGTGGFAYGEVQVGGWNRISAIGTGWTAGGGLEWMFMPNWSAKVEYLYTDLGNFNRNGGWGFGAPSFAWGGWINDRQYRFNTVRAGVNWHFNFGGAGGTPVLAKY